MAENQYRSLELKYSALSALKTKESEALRVEQEKTKQMTIDNTEIALALAT
jgi:hypothetical protein